MEPHDEIVAALLSVLEPLGGELRLLGRVADPLIGNASAKESYLFVPDLHLISPQRRAAFGAYGFNFEKKKLLARLLEPLARLRETWDVMGQKKLVTIQIGDFFDLWREFGHAAKPEEIDDETHGELRDLLYRGGFRNKPYLKATMLLGNHDTKRGVPLNEIPYTLKAMNRSSSGQPFLFATHGDAFDLMETLMPDWLSEFIVHFLGRLTPVNKYTIESWGKKSAKLNKPLGELKDFIMAPEHALGFEGEGAVKVEVGAALPKILARRTADPKGVTHGRFPDFYQALGDAAIQFPSCRRLRVVVVGHSHHAAMILCRPPGGGRPLLLMDVGSWIEKCSYPLDGGDVAIEPSAQLGVIHGNDVRLYQVRMPQD
ncbi:MAG TPA: hypothetical protein VGC54_10605 [Planctomycetota bacterium]